MNKFIFIGLSLGLVLTTSSCKKEEPICCDETNPECPNYNPCFDKTVANAAFTFGEVCVIKYGGGGSLPLYRDSIIYSDTVYWLNLVEFSVQQTDYDSLKWFIGSEILETATVRRKGFPKNQMVQVQLIVWKTADSLCFPNAAISDTVRKYFYSAEFPVFYEKRYKGIHNSAPNDSSFVSFVTGEHFGIPLECYQWPGLGPDGSYFAGYRHFIWTNMEYTLGCSDGKAVRISAYATDTTFEADYTYISGPAPSSEPWVKDHFLGDLTN